MKLKPVNNALFLSVRSDRITIIEVYTSSVSAQTL